MTSSASGAAADPESVIKESLFAFVNAHLPTADVAVEIDEIVLAYVVAVLEEGVGSEPMFDVDGFCEMMAAYLPAFGALNHATVCAWMFELEAKVNAAQQEKQQQRPEGGGGGGGLRLPTVLPRQATGGAASCDGDDVTTRRVHTLSERSSSTDAGSDYFFDDEIDALQVMFPHVCALEVKHCVAIACGDVERATHILLHRRERGEAVSSGANASLVLAAAAATKAAAARIDDAELKHRIIERYSYIEHDALAREHRPVAPKVAPKKLVRYRDNKIVSLKGERYTEVKKGDDVEDVSCRRGKKQQQQQQQQQPVASHCP